MKEMKDDVQLSTRELREKILDFVKEIVEDLSEVGLKGIPTFRI